MQLFTWLLQKKSYNGANVHSNLQTQRRYMNLAQTDIKGTRQKNRTKENI